MSSDAENPVDLEKNDNDAVVSLLVLHFVKDKNWINDIVVGIYSNIVVISIKINLSHHLINNFVNGLEVLYHNINKM